MSDGDDVVEETPESDSSDHEVVEEANTTAAGQDDTDAPVAGTTETDGGTPEADISDSGNATASPEPGISDAAQAGTPTETDEAFGGAPDDEEMPLTEHIEEMIRRLATVIVIMAGVSALVFWITPDLINWLWYSFLPGSPENCVNGATGTTACPRVYHPLGLLFARVKVASLVGFIVALPVFVYQTYLFMRPGLYPHERRYYLAAVPTSLVLAFVGLAFSYFLVLPFIFTYFLFYSEDVAQIAFGLTETFDLILLMMGMFAAIFQIPLLIMLAIMMGVTTRRWLEAKRYYFWLGFAGFAFLFSPDPTGMAPFIVGVTMVILYEITLLLLRWTER